MSDHPSYHMTPEEFRRLGYRLIDWIADYEQRVADLPVLSRAEPGSIRAQLPAAPPEQGEALDRVFEDLERIILPGITHWQSPNFFAYFPANTSGPSILGDLLCSGLGVQGMLWATSPACTELETHLLDWMAELLALPAEFRSAGAGGGVIQDSASGAALCAIIAARERKTGLVSNESGCDGRLTAYASTEAHSSIEKAIKIAGIGRKNLRLIPVDERSAMRTGELETAIRTDIAAGRLPFFVSATIGTTAANGLDPLPEIGRIASQNGLWFHVDGAMSGTAALCPEFRYIQEGLEFADSYCTNPHKWMFTNFDCDCMFVRDRSALIRALSILPEYLRNRATESGAVIDYRDWQIPLGRRFRSLKLWFVLRHYGREGLQYHIRRHVALAQEFAGWIEAHPDFELALPPPLNLVCFRHRGGEAANQAILDGINRSGKAYLSHARLAGQLTLRLCVGQTRTEAEHVKAVWQLIQQAAAAWQKTPSPESRGKQ
ncbi:MAG TPA: pyridoxal-dependent decarboxylase [bacterium]|nr:pyridoxal-dependent decarboxylase [bacterium]